MAEIIGMEEADFKELGRRIKSGAVFVYPTDTVYGLGCAITSETAVGRVFKLKGRARGKPLSVAFGDLEQLLSYADAGRSREERLKKDLPGPHTFILKNKRVPKYVTGALETVGVRIPAHGPLRELIREAGEPVVTTSANLAGGEPPANLEEVPGSIIEGADFALDGGRCGSGKPSRIENLLTGERLR